MGTVTLPLNNLSYQRFPIRLLLLTKTNASTHYLTERYTGTRIPPTVATPVRESRPNCQGQLLFVSCNKPVCMNEPEKILIEQTRQLLIQSHIDMYRLREAIKLYKAENSLAAERLLKAKDLLYRANKILTPITTSTI